MGKEIEIPEHKLHRWINLLGIDGKLTKKIVQKDLEVLKEYEENN